MEPSKLKTEVSAADFEIETQKIDLQSKIRVCHIVESLRVAMTGLALVAGLVVLGLSADPLKVYNDTHVPPEFLLPLWPDDFDLRPTQALVAGGTIVLAVNLVSLLASKVQSLRNRPTISTPTSLAVPAVGSIVAVVAVALSYAANPAGHTIHSWTCRWREVPMETRPHFGTLCAEGQVGLGLAVLLIPLEAAVLGVAAYGIVLQRKVGALVRERDARKGSPAFS